METIFKKDDLVKNKTSISWRNQEVTGIVLEVIDYPCWRNNEMVQILKIKWISPTIASKTLWQTYYSTSVELIASA